MTGRKSFSRSDAGIAVSAVVVLLGLMLAACSSSSKSSTTGSSAAGQGSVTTSAAGQGSVTTSAPGGQESVATGAPIAIAMPNLQGSTQGVNLPETSQAAQAAVEWINHHGGINGRPLKLSVCNLLTTPASDVSCGNSIAAAGPVAVVAGGVDNAQPIVTSLAQAGIPYVTAAGVSAIETTSPDAFSFSPGNTGSYVAVSQYEQEHGGKIVSLILIAAPGAAAAVQASAAPSFGLHGVTVKVTLTSPTGQSDLAPTIQAATQGNPSGVFLDEDPTTCIAGLNAKGTLAVSSSIRFYADSACETDAVVKGAGANANNTIFLNVGAVSKTDDSDYATYNSAMNQYAPGVTHLGFAPNGFLGVMNLYRVLQTMGSTPITSASVLTALHNAKNVKSFLGDGATFTCDGHVIKASPSICGDTMYIEQYTTSGGFKYLEQAKIPAGA